MLDTWGSEAVYFTIPVDPEQYWVSAGSENPQYELSTMFHRLSVLNQRLITRFTVANSWQVNDVSCISGPGYVIFLTRQKCYTSHEPINRLYVDFYCACDVNQVSFTAIVKGCVYRKHFAIFENIQDRKRFES